MQAIQSYLDSTYLKTDYESGSEFLQNFILEAIEHEFKLVMIRPEIVSFARTLIDNKNSKTLVGTVIDFPSGNSSLEDKISQANIAIENGADELDFVINYEAFKNGQEALLKEQILKCTSLCLSNKKTIKWIIEIAALSKTEIKNICLLGIL
jgi:deoxyribose-phosphate aldolase